MINNSTNINKTNNHFSSTIIEQKKGKDKTPQHMLIGLKGLWCLTPLSTIFQLYIVAVMPIGNPYILMQSS
jgi:hypothetical protein